MQTPKDSTPYNEPSPAIAHNRCVTVSLGNHWVSAADGDRAIALANRIKNKTVVYNVGRTVPRH